MFNEVKGLKAAVARFHGFDTVEDFDAAEGRKAKRAEAARKGARTKRSKTDPVMLAIMARRAGCTDAKSVAGWIRRYINGGASVADSGPVSPR